MVVCRIKRVLAATLDSTMADFSNNAGSYPTVNTSASHHAALNCTSTVASGAVSSIAALDANRYTPNHSADPNGLV